MFSNGKIIRYTYNVTIQGQVRSSESIPVNRSETDSISNQRKITALGEIHLGNEQSVRVDITASNSVGTSPATSLLVPRKGKGIQVKRATL